MSWLERSQIETTNLPGYKLFSNSDLNFAARNYKYLQCKFRHGYVYPEVVQLLNDATFTRNYLLGGL